MISFFFYSSLDHIWPPISSTPSLFILLKRGRYSLSLILSSALCLHDYSSHPASSLYSTHTPHLCSSSYLHHPFSCNLPPTFACSSQSSLLFSRSLSQAHSLFVDSGCSQGRTFFFLLLICPFPSPYFKISAPIWFIHHITFIFSCLILHFPFHLLQLANIYFFLAGIKQEDFRCQTLNLGQPSSIQGSAAPFYRKFQQWHQKTDRI